MENIKSIISFPDLFITSNYREEFIFDVIKEPIIQSCRDFCDIKIETNRSLKYNFLEDFDEKLFKNLLGNENEKEEILKIKNFFILPSAAEDYIKEKIPKNSFLIFFEIPPSIESIIKKLELKYIDIRNSPLKFSRDLNLAIRSNDLKTEKNIKSFEIPEEELRLEASILRANLRKHRAYINEKNIHTYNLKESLIFIPQLPHDIDTLCSSGKFLTIKDFPNFFTSEIKEKNILVMTDHQNNFQKKSALNAISEITSLTGKQAIICPQNSYQILTSDENIEIFSINSEVCQEASWFQKKSTSLTKQKTQLDYCKKENSDSYANIYFNEIINPIFWHRILFTKRQEPKIKRIRNLNRNYFREYFDEWGDYEKVMTWERDYHKKSFSRSGGYIQTQDIAFIKKIISEINTLAKDSSRYKFQSIKNTKDQKTAYIIGNGPSLSELKIDALMQKDSFWFNKAFALKNNGYDFKPKYYFLRDVIGLQKWLEEFININSEIKFIDSKGYSFLKKNRPEILEYQNILPFVLHRAKGNFMYESEDNFSSDPSLFVNCGMTSVLDAVQIAAYMGYSRILIGGVDLDYSLPYFYGERNDRPETALNNATTQMAQSFKVAKAVLEKKGIEFFKITSSPNLDLDYFEDKEVIK